MKLLTIAVPCYNSQDYMSHCIDTLLSGGDDVEIIIINDGSTDSTLEIAREYEERYPAIVKVINQENGGHGAGVNAGLAAADGLYYKVVDSDDWVDEDVLAKILTKIREFSQLEDNEKPDMIVSNFIYDKEGAPHKKVMQYRGMLPENQIFGWDDVKWIMKGHYILMHAVMYRTATLRESGMKLPEHTFYVDNIFVYTPFPYVKKMYYMNELLYHYYIGREDQSVNESVMMGRIDQQIRVNLIMLKACDLSKLENAKLRKYMYNYLEIITVITTILLTRIGTDESERKRKNVWRAIRKVDKALYRKMRTSIMLVGTNLPGKYGKKISVKLYQIANLFYGFN